MIRLFTGTPSSGKSFNAVKYILWNLKFKKPVIANFALKFTEKEIKKGYAKNFYFVPNNQYTIEMLILFALDHNFIETKKENQCLVVFDEAGGKFNPKAEKKEIVEWIDFFSQHAKIGFDIILIAQSKAMMDRQIQKFIEYEHVHRKLNRYGIFVILPFPVFVSVEMWMQMAERISAEFFLYSKKVSDHYDRYKMFDGFKMSEALMQKIRAIQPDIVTSVNTTSGGNNAIVDALRANLAAKNILINPVVEKLDIPITDIFVDKSK